MKKDLGLFDDPYRYCDLQRESEMIYHEDHLEAALDMAKKSIVLLKNENQFLPLNEDQEKIVVIGDLADDKDSPLGSWRIGSDDNTSTSFLEGMKNHNIPFSYAQGAKLVEGQTAFANEVKINNSDKSGFGEAIKMAKNAEVVIMVLGEHGFQTGEGRSRTRLDFPGVQQELLEAIYAVNKNIVLVVMSGRPLVLTWADRHIPAILQTWQLGSQSGNAICEVLFGEYNPSGKLPMTFPRSLGQVPIYYNHYSTGRPGPSNIVFWSHYIDETNKPLYPFGYGLSYTEFEYSNLQIDAANQEKIKVLVTVKNTGEVAGEEVTQLYISDKVATVVRPVKELKGFQKFQLLPNQSKEIEFFLTDKELGFYNNTGEFIVEAGEFEVMVGTNAQTGLKGKFTKE